MKNWKTTQQRITAQENAKQHLNFENDEGRHLRKSFFNKTKNPIFKESNFQKNIKKGKVYTRKEVAGGINKAKKEENRLLRNEYKRLKKEGKINQSFKEFKRTNESQDFISIKESFNSPT